MRISLKSIIAIALASSLYCQQSMAGNWEWGTNLGLSSNWNDNPGLADNDLNPESTFRMLGSYNAEFVRLGRNNTFEFKPRITRDYYPDERFKDLESTDLFFPGSIRLRRPTTNWNLGYNLSRQNVLSDESTVTQSEVTSLNADDTLYRASLSPGVSWIVSPKDQIAINASLSVNDYELKNTGRADGYGGAVNASYSRTVTERHSLGFTASYSSFESERSVFVATDDVPPVILTLQTDNTSSSESLTADYGYQLSPTSAFNVQFGAQESNSENTNTIVETGQPIQFGPAKTSFKSTTYNIGYKKTTKRGGFNLNASRRVTPATNGQPQDRYDVRFNGDIDLSARLGATWRINVSQQQNIILAATEGELNRETRILVSDFTLNWSINRQWNANLGYGFRHRDRQKTINDPDGAKATSNRISLGVTYVLKRIKK